MKLGFAAAAVLIVTALTTPAHAEAAATTTPANQTRVVKKHAARRTSHAQRPSNHEVTYDRDSKDPNVGWHTQGGMRVCTQDCDNPEIPGSGYTCRDVKVLGMAMRECDWSSR